jgi:hypothetical protein
MQAPQLHLPFRFACCTQGDRAHLALLLRLRPWVRRCGFGHFDSIRFHGNGSNAQIVAVLIVSIESNHIELRRQKSISFDARLTCELDICFLTVGLCDSYRRRRSLRMRTGIVPARRTAPRSGLVTCGGSVRGALRRRDRAPCLGLLLWRCLIVLPGGERLV